MLINVCRKNIRLEGKILQIARIDGEKYTYPDDPDVMAEALRKYKAGIDLFTFLQRPDETAPKYGYVMELDNLAVLPVSTFDEWWNHQIRSVPRNRARQAAKRGVVVKEVEFDGKLLEGIVEIHNETPVRQGRRFPHFGMDVEGARKYAGSFLERSIFLAAILEDSVIGFVKLVVDETGTHACVVNILSMLKHSDKAPTNALIAQAVRSCAERGIRYLVYEHFAYGKKAADSLSHFKEVNGFRRVDVPRYYIPLSALGSAALKLGLHRRLVEYIPEALMTKYRDHRTAWYRGRLPTSADAG